MAVAEPLDSCKVYTSPRLASAMVDSLDGKDDFTWLEPSCGAGSFISALAQRGVCSERITAIDLDTRETRADFCADTQRGVDFLEWSSKTERRFDRIVGNPPYVSINRLPDALRKNALSVRGPNGEKTTLRGNTWYAFLCASLGLLRRGGALAFVLPAAWDYAGYAAPLREALPGMFGEVEVHRSRKRLFEEVQEGSVVLIARGYQRSGNLRRVEHSDENALVASLKRHRHSKADCAPASPPNSAQDIGETFCLGDHVRIRLGGVTGDSGYFLMNEMRRKELGLPTDCLRPALTKARHLVAGSITAQHWRELRDKGERVWLFDPPPRMHDHPAVRAYLAHGSQDGGCNLQAFKIRNRNPWYRVPSPRRVNAFLTGMSGSGPWLCVKEMPNLTATNTLYVAEFLTRHDDDTVFSLALSLLTAEARSSAQQACRLYADGLPKYEPGDLAKLRIPRPRVCHGAKRVYLSAVSALLSGDVRGATEQAEAFLRE